MNRFVQTLLLNLLIVDLYGEKDPFEEISTRPPPAHTTKNYEDRLKNFHRLSSVQNPRLPKSELKVGLSPFPGFQMNSKLNFDMNRAMQGLQQLETGIKDLGTGLRQTFTGPEFMNTLERLQGDIMELVEDIKVNFEARSKR